MCKLEHIMAGLKCVSECNKAVACAALSCWKVSFHRGLEKGV